MTFEDFNDAPDTPFAGARLTLESFGRERFLALPAPRVPCGFFVLGLPDGGTRRFRVRLEKGGIFAGKRTLAHLTGPDGTDEWTTVALVAADGFAVFKRWKSERVARHAGILWALLNGEAVDGCGLRECDVRCRWSMHKLSGKRAGELHLNAKAAKAWKLWKE